MAGTRSSTWDQGCTCALSTPSSASGPMRGRGEGSVYKRAADGMWCATVELPPLNGKRRRKQLVAKTKAEVLRKLAAARTDLERTGDMPTASQTLETWLSYWLDKVASKRVRPTTLYTYRKQIESQVLPVLGRYDSTS